MRLHGPQSRFELILDGRPDVEGWCAVRIAVDGPDGNWSGTSRCLRADEVVRLADWLEAAAESWMARDRFDTLDNEFSLELTGGEPQRIRIYLEWTFRPVRVRLWPCGEFFQEYPVTKRSLRQAAASLREQLR